MTSQQHTESFFLTASQSEITVLIDEVNQLRQDVEFLVKPKKELEITKLERILQELQSIIERENKRHIMDEHLSHSMRNLLEDEIIPMLEAEVNYDPTPQTSYDFLHQ